MNRATFKYLSANFKHADGTDIMDAYAIKEIDGHKIGFVGICTPESYTKSTPVYFQDASGNYVYTFSEDTFYATIQAAVDAAKAAGAEAIVAIGHTGMDGSTEEWTTKAIIENTNGIDAYIDGHSHEVSAGPDYTHMENGVLQHYSFFNKDGKQVFYTQTGTKLKNFGELKIEFTPTVQVTSVMHSVADLTDKDSTIEALITNARQREIAFSGTEIGTSEVKLFAKDDDGTWLVRHQETNLGDYNADAYLWRTGADIALMNAGGVRTNVNVGTVTKKDLISVNPWMNQVGVIEATGQTILDALEHGARFYPNNNGGYLQVAGLTYEINTKVTTSPVVEDSKGSFLSVDPTKPRRVQNVLVCGEPIDPNRTYRVAGTFYILQYSGDGMSMFKNCPVISGDYPSDAEVLIEYMTQKLNGVISAEAYGNKDGKADLSNVIAERKVKIHLNKVLAPATTPSSSTNTTQEMNKMSTPKEDMMAKESTSKQEVKPTMKENLNKAKEEMKSPMMAHQKTTSQDMMKKDNMSTLPETGETATNTAALGAFSAAFAFILGTLGLKAKKERN